MKRQPSDNRYLSACSTALATPALYHQFNSNIPFLSKYADARHKSQQTQIYPNKSHKKNRKMVSTIQLSLKANKQQLRERSYRISNQECAKNRFKTKSPLDCKWDPYPTMRKAHISYILYNMFISIYDNWLRLEPTITHLLKPKTKISEGLRTKIQQNLNNLQKMVAVGRNKNPSQAIERFQNMSLDQIENQMQINLIAIEQISEIVNNKKDILKHQMITGIEISQSRKIKTLKENLFTKEMLEKKEYIHNQRKASTESIIYTSQSLDSLVNTLIDRMNVVKFLSEKNKKFEASLTDPLKNLYGLKGDKNIKTQKVIDDLMDLMKDVKSHSYKKSNGSRNSLQLQEMSVSQTGLTDRIPEDPSKNIIDSFLNRFSVNTANKRILKPNKKVNFEIEEEIEGEDRRGNQLKQKYEGKSRITKSRRNINVGQKQFGNETQFKSNRIAKPKNESTDRSREVPKNSNQKTHQQKNPASPQPSPSQPNSPHPKNLQKNKQDKKSNLPHQQRPIQKIKTTNFKSLLKMKEMGDYQNPRQTDSESSGSKSDKKKRNWKTMKKRNRRYGLDGRFSFQQDIGNIKTPQTQLDHQNLLANYLTSFLSNSVKRPSLQKKTMKLFPEFPGNRTEVSSREQEFPQKTQKKVLAHHFNFDWNKEELLSATLPLNKEVKLQEKQTNSQKVGQNIFEYLRDFQKEAYQTWLQPELKNSKKNVKQFNLVKNEPSQRLGEIERIELDAQQAELNDRIQAFEKNNRLKFLKENKMFELSYKLLRSSNNVGQKNMEKKETI